MIEKTYQPAAVEGRIYAGWERAGAFRAGRPERADARRGLLHQRADFRDSRFGKTEGRRGNHQRRRGRIGSPTMRPY